VSLAVTFDAITGLGNTPSRINNGMSPKSGVKVGQGAGDRASRSAARPQVEAVAATQAPKTSDINVRQGFIISGSLVILRFGSGSRCKANRLDSS
jgi:hypothetical protein